MVLDDYFHSFGGSCGELFMVNIFIAQLTGTGPGPNVEPSKSKNKMAPIAIYSTGGQLVGVD